MSAIWAKAGIQVHAPQHSIQKLEAVFFEWIGLQKHKTRLTVGHKSKENEFVAQLYDLFDIAHVNALALITIPEDRAFLLSQRQKGRPGSIGAVDMVHMNRHKKAKKRIDGY